MAKRRQPQNKRIPFRYPSIDGPQAQYIGESCLLFEKHDGSNLYFLWHQSEGWKEYGTRRYPLTPDHKLFGPAWTRFQEKYADDILAIARQHKEFRNAKELIAFCEYFGKNTFAGLHAHGDTLDVKLFDVYLPNSGFVPPTDFRDHFGHLDIPKVHHEGPLTWELVLEVYNGKYPVGEGVVAKGQLLKRKRKGANEFEVWMAKFKTKSYLEELQSRAGENPDLQSEYEEMQEMHNQMLANK
ncbi:MAG: hypothetical protein ACFCD0_00910 [Gemmataceae bacterium]